MDNQEDEQEQQKPGMGEQAVNLAKQFGKNKVKAGTDAVKKVAKDALKKGAKQLIRKIVIPAIPYIAGFILAVLVVCVIIGAVTSIGDTIMSFFETVGDAIFGTDDTNSSSSTTDTTQSMIHLDDSGMLATTDEELLEIINANLDAMHIEKEDLRMGSEEDADEYLCNFMKASLSTELPYIPGGTR